MGSWLGGAWVGRGSDGLIRGAVAGFVLLAATVGAYLAAAAAAAPGMLPRLLVLAVVAGPAFGAAGAAIHRAGGGRLIGIAALPVALVAQVVVLAVIGPTLA